MNISRKEYSKMTNKVSKPTKSYINVPVAFVVGGLICTLGEGLIHLYIWLGYDMPVASALASATLIFLSVLMTGFTIYEKIAKHAGAGTLVPITGFANAMSSAAIEFRSEGLIMGIGGKLFAIVGPVITYGLSAAIIYGIIYYLWGSVFV